MTVPYCAPLYISEKATVIEVFSNPLNPSSLTLALSLVEFLDSCLLLPSLLSDLTVGGSPPEASPVSEDFSCRRSGDEEIDRNNFNSNFNLF